MRKTWTTRNNMVVKTTTVWTPKRKTVYDEMGLPIMSVRRDSKSRYLIQAFCLAEAYGRAWKEAFPWESLIWGSEE